MPGIVGLITKRPRAQAEAELNRMVESLRHEAFYQSETWIDEAQGIYIGWVERKEASFSGMPLRSKDGKLALVFSGEEYSQSDSFGNGNNGHREADRGAYLIELAQWHPEFPANLNGRFHGFLLDSRSDTSMLFNDRYGMHRVCYYEGNEAFYFAPEAKAILAVHSELRSIDQCSFGELVACGCVLEDRTIFQHIKVLPCGSVWKFRSGALEKKRTYFSPKEWEDQAALDEEQYYLQLRDAFANCLPRYFSGTERIGISLTGGLDTRVIMGWRKAEPNTLPCYTFGGMFRDCHDVKISRQIAKVCGQPHKVFEVGKDFLSRFPHYAERTIYLTEANVDVGRAADLYVSEKARQIAPIKITGNYGSEILRQLVMFKPVAPPPNTFCPEMNPYLDQAGRTYAQIRNLNPITFAAFRQSPWYHYGTLELEQTQVTTRSPYLDNDFVKAVYRAPRNGENPDLRLRLMKDGNPALLKVPTDLGQAANYSGLLGSIDRSIRTFTFKSEYAYDYGMPQWVAKIDHAFSPLHLERLFLGRHKFNHYRLWYRDYLANYVREILLDSRTLSRPYLNRAGVEGIVNSHLKGTQNHTLGIHKLLTVELLHRRFIDG